VIDEVNFLFRCLQNNLEEGTLFENLPHSLQERKNLLRKIYLQGNKSLLNRHFNFSCCQKFYHVFLRDLYLGYPGSMKSWSDAFEKVDHPEPLESFL